MEAYGKADVLIRTCKALKENGHNKDNQQQQQATQSRTPLA